MTAVSMPYLPEHGKGVFSKKPADDAADAGFQGSRSMGEQMH